MSHPINHNVHLSEKSLIHNVPIPSQVHLSQAEREWRAAVTAAAALEQEAVMAREERERRKEVKHQQSLQKKVN